MVIIINGTRSTRVEHDVARRGWLCGRVCSLSLSLSLLCMQMLDVVAVIGLPVPVTLLYSLHFTLSPLLTLLSTRISPINGNCANQKRGNKVGRNQAPQLR